ncbi:MAG: PEP-CTERM sorting domain-containing protein, partial [Verrucomicrobiota bacterium]
LNQDGELIGQWQPDGRKIDPQSLSSLFDSTAPTGLLDSFNGTDPNGTWTLFLADLSSGGESQLVNWNLQIETVPEPSTWMLFGMGAAWLCRGIFRRSRPIEIRPRT